jgi:hypothetical protein
MRDWLTNEHVIVAEDVLHEMRGFIDDINDPDTCSETLQGLILDVTGGIRQKVCI